MIPLPNWVCSRNLKSHAPPPGELPSHSGQGWLPGDVIALSRHYSLFLPRGINHSGAPQCPLLSQGLWGSTKPFLKDLTKWHIPSMILVRTDPAQTRGSGGTEGMSLRGQSLSRSNPAIAPTLSPATRASWRTSYCNFILLVWKLRTRSKISTSSDSEFYPW